MARPKNKRYIGLYTDEQTWESAKAIADEKGMLIGEYVNQALMDRVWKDGMCMPQKEIAPAEPPDEPTVTFKTKRMFNNENVRQLTPAPQPDEVAPVDYPVDPQILKPKEEDTWMSRFA